jgi:hypothetical protein
MSSSAQPRASEYAGSCMGESIVTDSLSLCRQNSHGFVLEELLRAGGEAEKSVDLADDGAVLALIEFAVGVELAQGGPGPGIAVFLNQKGFTGEAREGIDHSDVAVGFSSQGTGDVGRSEAIEEIVDLSGGGLQTCFGDFRNIDVLDEVGGGFVLGALEIEVFEPLEVLLKPGLVPIRHVFWIEGDAELRHPRDHHRVGRAVEEEIVDGVAVIFGETSDFAFQAAWREGCGIEVGG